MTPTTILLIGFLGGVAGSAAIHMGTLVVLLVLIYRSQEEPR